MMRLCYTVATPECEDAKMLAVRGPLAAAFALLCGAGYQGAELMVRDPRMLDARAIRAEAAGCGLVLPAVSTGQLRKERGLQLCAVDEGARSEAVDGLRRVIDFAAEVGAAVVNIGTLRGTLPPGEGRASAMDAAEISVGEALEHAVAAGVEIALEPQCRYVSNWLNTVDESVAFLGRFRVKRPRLVFDFYHALLEERSVLASLIRAHADVAWVQVSDNDRRAPGSGQQHFGEFIRVLAALRYDGFVSVECTPAADQAVGVQVAARHLIPFLEEQES